MDAFSIDEIAKMHETALRTLEELGVRTLLPEARGIFKAGCAIVDDEMVYIGRDMLEAALASASRSIRCLAGARDKDVLLELGSLVFNPAFR